MRGRADRIGDQAEDPYSQGSSLSIPAKFSHVDIEALLLAHSNQIGSFNAQGIWALELQGMFLIGALTVGLIGAGRYSLGGDGGPWN